MSTTALLKNPDWSLKARRPLGLPLPGGRASTDAVNVTPASRWTKITPLTSTEGLGAVNVIPVAVGRTIWSRVNDELGWNGPVGT